MLSIRNYIPIISLLLLLISLYFSQNIKLDASADTLILKEDKTYKFFQYYNKIFPNKNYLVLGVKSNKKIDKDYIANINLIKDKLEEFDNIESTFSIVDAPILLLNNLNISDLSTQKISNINNSNFDLNLIFVLGKSFSAST